MGATIRWNIIRMLTLRSKKAAEPLANAQWYSYQRTWKQKSGPFHIHETGPTSEVRKLGVSVGLTATVSIQESFDSSRTAQSRQLAHLVARSL